MKIFQNLIFDILGWLYHIRHVSSNWNLFVFWSPNETKTTFRVNHFPGHGTFKMIKEKLDCLDTVQENIYWNGLFLLRPICQYVYKRSFWNVLKCNMKTPFEMLMCTMNLKFNFLLWPPDIFGCWTTPFEAFWSLRYHEIINRIVTNSIPSYTNI